MLQAANTFPNAFNFHYRSNVYDTKKKKNVWKLLYNAANLGGGRKGIVDEFTVRVITTRRFNTTFAR